MLQLQQVGYLKVYKRTTPERFLNDGIEFSNNVRDAKKLGTSLVAQLSLFNGCCFGTMEVMWKYYRAVTTCNQRERQQRENVLKLMTAKSALSASVSNECVLPDNPKYLLSLVRMELDNANINKFVSFIDSVYMEVLLQQYHGFATGEGYLLGHKYVIKMYGLMKVLFPFVHLVIAMTVSSPCS